MGWCANCHSAATVTELSAEQVLAVTAYQDAHREVRRTWKGAMPDRLRPPERDAWRDAVVARDHAQTEMLFALEGEDPDAL